MDEVYRPDMSLKGKLRRRITRLQHRRPAHGRPDRPMVSFTFDDAPASAITVGGEILAERDLRATYFISIGIAGQQGHMGPYASREQVRRAAGQGHEIACHTYSHLDCGSSDGATIQADLERSRAAFAAWDLPEPVTFAYPFGDVSAAAKRLLSPRFALARAIHPGLVADGVDLNQAPSVGIEGPEGEALAHAWLARAEARPGWLILFTHGVEPEATPFCASRDGFTRLVDEAVARGFDVVTVAEGARRFSNPA